MARVAIVEYYKGKGEVKQFRANPPTTRADGTPLDIADIAGYVCTEVVLKGEGYAPSTIEHTGLNIVQLDQNFTGFDLYFEVDDPANEPGEYIFSFRTVDLQGQKSEPSDSVSVVVRAPLAVPNPPEILGLW